MADGTTTRRAPATGTVLLTIVGVSLRRLLRSRAVWVVGAIAMLPVVLAAALKTKGDVTEVISVIELGVMAVLPCVFVASSIGEEIEDRTTTYLWSRPLARWMLVVGKLLALAPLSALLVVASWVIAVLTGGGSFPLQSALAFAP